MSFTSQYLEETAEIVRRLDPMAIDQMVAILAKTRAQQGRLFILGVGGSAANASHAVNDFRKITGIEAYAPTDNVSELTARTNDEGWAGKGAWAGRQRWWLYGYRGGCLRGCANGESTSCHPAFRGLSGRDLAPAGVASRLEASGNKVGVSPLTPGNRAVFLDRDGVVNHAIIRERKPFPPANVSELVINRDAIIGLPLLKRLGFLLVVVTNQPDVRRGSTSIDTVRRIHDAIRSELPIDDFFICCHDDRDGCDCRKPLPGLLLRAATRYDIQLDDSFLIGDRWRDIDAGYRAGVQTALIDYGYEERGPDHEPDIRVKSLLQAVQWITAERQ